ncbi:MAG: hypothetical protein KAJ49_10235 [Arcobacteraceae bacterium]|nr:hypothetical protein [Arcobacteraceae bacterium]
MNTKLKILFPLIALIFATGCTQKTKIAMKVPGELNVKGIHKIAVVDFSSIKANSEAGVYSANDDLLKLAKDEVINLFCNEPFYSFSNLEIEANIKKSDINAEIKDRFDGLLYGKLWWVTTPEYQNIIPSKANLEKYTIVKYVSGRSKKGKTYYSYAHVTTETKDKAFNMHYRVKNATLMMSLNLYKVSKDGKVSKVTEVFEVAKGKFDITNGKYSNLISLIGEQEKLDKFKSLQKKESSFFGSKTSKKVNSDFKITNIMTTMPSSYTLNQMLIAKISKTLQKMIAPTTQEFEIEIEKGDSKVEKMFDYSAFNSISSYIVEEKLALGNSKFFEDYYEVDFLENTKNMLAYNDKKEFDDKIVAAAKKAKKGEAKKEPAVYKPIEAKKLEELATDHLKSIAPDIYNYGLATEAIGNFEKSLEIYRYLFNDIDDKNQLYADGIGRSLLALDMGDKVSEKTLNKIKAKKKNRL